MAPKVSIIGVHLPCKSEIVAAEGAFRRVRENICVRESREREKKREKERERVVREGEGAFERENACDKIGDHCIPKKHRSLYSTIAIAHAQWLMYPFFSYYWESTNTLSLSLTLSLTLTLPLFLFI